MNTLDKVASQPTDWDSPSNYMGSPLSEFSNLFVVLGKNRDSAFLDQHNFDEALTLLGGESESVIIHRFGHWACGWIEYLCVTQDKQAQAQAIVDQLEDYPILNEDSFSEKEWEQAQDYWESLSISERVELCQDAGINVFSARHNWIPQGDDQGYVYDHCRPE